MLLSLPEYKRFMEAAEIADEARHAQVGATLAPNALNGVGFVLQLSQICGLLVASW